MVHGLAVVTMVATVFLIIAGGLVTSTGAGLAVPDWPNTFGYNMFLYPWSKMVGGVFYEHSHRLIGATVGLLTLALAAAVWPAGGALRALGLVAVAAVSVQGVLGGLRVVLRQEIFAIVHGSVAPAFLALVGVIAFLTSGRARIPVHGIDATSRSLAAMAVGLVYLQIVFGALVTHSGWLDFHIAGAIAVFAVVPVVTARLRRSADPVAAPLSRWVLALLGVQFLLGIASYLSRFTPIWIPGGQVTMLVVPVAHRLMGALILAAVAILAVRTRGAGRALGRPVTGRLAEGLSR